MYTTFETGLTGLTLDPYEYKLKLKSLIEEGSVLGNSKALQDLIEKDISSKQKKLAISCNKYYVAENDILNESFNSYSIAIPVRDNSNQIVSYTYKTVKSTASDNKIAHNFIKNIIDQKIDMALSNPIKFSLKNKDEKFEQLFNEYIDENFDLDLMELATNASKQGQSAMMFYYPADSDKLQYSVIEGSEFIPVYDTKTQKKLINVIRYYSTETIIDNKTLLITKVEIWSPLGVEYWEKVDNIYTNIGFQPILTVQTVLDNQVKQEESFSFGKVPFAILKNNKDCLSDLNDIKSLIDDYDFITSLTSNDIADLQNAFIFASGINDNADEFRNNLKIYKVATTSTPDANITAVNIPIESEAREKHLTRIKEDIYKFSSSLDFYDDSFKNAVSGEALKRLLIALDLKVNRFLRSVSVTLRDIMYFIVADINRIYGTKYDYKEIEWNFDAKSFTNRKEIIEEIILLYNSGLLDRKEALDLLPLDIGKEELLKRLESQIELPDIADEE